MCFLVPRTASLVFNAFMLPFSSNLWSSTIESGTDVVVIPAFLHSSIVWPWSKNPRFPSPFHSSRMLSSYPYADLVSIFSAFSTVVGGGCVLLANALVCFFMYTYFLAYALQTSLCLDFLSLMYLCCLGVAVSNPLLLATCMCVGLD